MQVLTDVGRPDVAYQIATRTDRPSWGYMVSKGATTSWERWDTDTQDGGMNGESQKILSGNLEAWCYQTLAGINYDPERPGFKHIVLRPHPVGDLTWVRAAHTCLYGKIESDWRLDGDRLRWRCVVPPGTTATVVVPTHSPIRSANRGSPSPVPREFVPPGSRPSPPRLRLVRESTGSRPRNRPDLWLSGAAGRGPDRRFAWRCGNREFGAENPENFAPLAAQQTASKTI